MVIRPGWWGLWQYDAGFGCGLDTTEPCISGNRHQGIKLRLMQVSEPADPIEQKPDQDQQYCGDLGQDYRKSWQDNSHRQCAAVSKQVTAYGQAMRK